MRWASEMSSFEAMRRVFRRKLHHIILYTLIYLHVLDCLGSENGLSHDTNAAARYERYRKMYTNCTHVSKSLEIVFLNAEDDYDLSFLSNIQEVCVCIT
jgi:hypothetical protein